MTETTDPEDELHAAFVEQFPPIVTPELRATVRAYKERQKADADAEAEDQAWAWAWIYAEMRDAP